MNLFDNLTVTVPEAIEVEEKTPIDYDFIRDLVKASKATISDGNAGRLWEDITIASVAFTAGAMHGKRLERQQHKSRSGE